jgi:peptidoglycan/xylan/chitin deacetylase (PgdA/CDA1 family)
MAAKFVATLFVPAVYVGATSRWLMREGDERRRVMGWSDIRSVAEAGVEVGAHSRTHPRLDRLSDVRLREELERSSAVVEDGLGPKPKRHGWRAYRSVSSMTPAAQPAPHATVASGRSRFG